MTAAVRSELRKFFTTRLWWGMAIAVFLSAAVFALAFGFLYTSSAMRQTGAPAGTPTQVANSVYTAGLGVGYLLLLTIGIMQIGSEYRHKTISGTFLATPKRSEAMLAKVVALLVIGAGYGLLSLVGAMGIGSIVLAARGHSAFPSSEVFRTAALSLLVLGLWALIGLGAGILIPNQVAALLISVGVAWIVEPLAVFGLQFWTFGREHIAPYLPSQATSAVVNSVQGSANDVRLAWWAGALVLAAWAAALAGLGIWRTVRQDVS